MFDRNYKYTILQLIITLLECEKLGICVFDFE